MRAVVISVLFTFGIACAAAGNGQSKAEFSFELPPEKVLNAVFGKESAGKLRAVQQKGFLPILSFLGSLPSLFALGQTVATYGPSAMQAIGNAGSAAAGWASDHAAHLIGAAAGAATFFVAHRPGSQQLSGTPGPRPVPGPQPNGTPGPRPGPRPVPQPTPAPNAVKSP